VVDAAAYRLARDPGVPITDVGAVNPRAPVAVDHAAVCQRRRQRKTSWRARWRITGGRAAVALLISSGAFPYRADFAGRFTEHGTSSGTATAAVDWDAAIAALNVGELPCSGGERPVTTRQRW
jgi:hypothetical protein